MPWEGCESRDCPFLAISILYALQGGFLLKTIVIISGSSFVVVVLGFHFLPVETNIKCQNSAINTYDI